MSVIKQLGKCGLSLKGAILWASTQEADEDLVPSVQQLIQCQE